MKAKFPVLRGKVILRKALLAADTTDTDSPLPLSVFHLLNNIWWWYIARNFIRLTWNLGGNMTGLRLILRISPDRACKASYLDPCRDKIWVQTLPGTGALPFLVSFSVDTVTVPGAITLFCPRPWGIASSWLCPRISVYSDLCLDLIIDGTSTRGRESLTVPSSFHGW